MCYKVALMECLFSMPAINLFQVEMCNQPKEHLLFFLKSLPTNSSWEISNMPANFTSVLMSGEGTMNFVGYAIVNIT